MSKVFADIKKKRVLVFYQYFTPAVLAGGPTVSLGNMINYLHEDIEFYVYCTNRDLDNSVLDVKKDVWIDYKSQAKVYYAESNWNLNGIYKAIKFVKPNVVYINGAMSIVTVIYPMLLVWLFWKLKIKVIIAPRGMLLKNALQQKKIKKIIYLPVFKWLSKMNKTRWHVTGIMEKQELKNIIPNLVNDKICLVSNVPTLSLEYTKEKKRQNPLKLLTVALISPMKNIFNVIQALNMLDIRLEYSIFGSVKDVAYWTACLNQVKNLPSNISFKYQGNVAHSEIAKVFAGHDIYIQPSESENFSHSIFEALMSGLPVITSHNTPWNFNERRAGWNVDPYNIDEIARVIKKAYLMHEDEFKEMRCQARQMAETYLAKSKMKDGYLALF